MKPFFFYLGVFLISGSTLVLQIVQTRILSVVAWYHLAFFVISLALFGLTAGAVWVYLRAARFTNKTLSYDLAYFSGLFALATVIGLAVQMTLAPVISSALTTLWVWTELALCLSTRGTPYFALIGTGFIMVEIALLQRMTVFLGHPIYSLSVLLFSLILTTGMGSFLSEQWVLHNRARMAIWATLTGGYLLILPLVLSELFMAFNHATLGARIAICVASITPNGLLLGFGFPTGMRLMAAIDSRPTPWFWGINGAAGVLASISAIAVSLAFGIASTLMLGALCYLLLIPVSLALFQSAAIKASKRPAAPARVTG
jgi:hypothetical protein